MNNEETKLPAEVQDKIDHVTAIIDGKVRALCEEIGYGAVAQSAEKLEREWRKKLSAGLP